MTVIPLPHAWSKDALLAKAQRYASVMLEQAKDEWTFGFWSALTLEILARAALAKISPVLLAENRDWNNIYFALGHQPTVNKFTPKSASTSEVLSRLGSVLPKFTKENANFCSTHIQRRNGELHSGDLPFDSLNTSDWLSKFYLACQILLESLDQNLEDLFGPDEADAADTLISALKDDAAKTVLSTIAAYTKVWEGKGQTERDTLQKQAIVWANRHSAHRVECPACKSTALLHGSPIGPATPTLDEGVVVEKQNLLPSQFECVACELKISGYSKLNAAGLGDAFTATTRYDAVDYFDGYEPEWEPDFNEH